MNILKRIFRGLSSQAFKFSLFFMAMSAATVAILGTPRPIKQALHDSGLYAKVVPSVIDSAKQEQAKNPGQDGGDIDLNDPAIQKAVQDALPPAYLEQTANGALDGLFDWLNGKTEEPRIVIDLTGPKQKLATGIGEAAYAKAVAKPTCTRAQLATIDRNNIDVFDIPCIPPGIDLRAEQTKLVNKILTSDDFIKDTTIDVAEQKKENGEPAVNFGDLDKVPLAFRIFSAGAIIWGIVGAISGALLVLLHEERKRGIWVVGRAFVTTGVMLIIVAGTAHYLASQVHATTENQNDLLLILPKVAQDIAGQFNKVLLIFGGSYVVIGAGTMITLKMKKSETAPTSPSQKPIPKSKA